MDLPLISKARAENESTGYRARAKSRVYDTETSGTRQLLAHHPVRVERSHFAEQKVCTGQHGYLVHPIVAQAGTAVACSLNIERKVRCLQAQQRSSADV